MSITYTQRIYLSILHIQAAAFFCRKCYEIENGYSDMQTLESNTRSILKYYAINTILSSVCFLEATINEIYCDTEKTPHFVQGLGEPIIKVISQKWRENFERKPFILKYQKALELVGSKKFEETDTLLKDVIILNSVRNAMVHYKPETILIKRTPKSKNDINDECYFEQLLKDKFNSSVIVGTEDPFFPERCLGHGCAEWAVKTSANFVEEFLNRMGIYTLFFDSKDLLTTRE